MKEPITYKLNQKQFAATVYYPAVSIFTDKVLISAEKSIAAVANDYRRYIIENELENLRTTEEYIFELLNLGVLWRVYGGTTLRIKVAPFRFLAYLADIRKKYRIIKTIVDPIRGLLMSLFLVRGPIEPIEQPPKNLNEFERLVRWLEATGDFREDAFRFIRWLAYFSNLTPKQFSDIMEKILEFSDWFEKESIDQLGSFTPNVESFLEKNRNHYRWREDRFACLRSRVEYHLNMVGAEILNRAFQSDFQAAQNKTVLVPGCMRFRSAEECEGIKTENGILCSGCESKCNVNRIRLMGQTHNFNVCILPHSTDLSRWAAKPEAPSSGVVGVACLSVLVQGGWELKRWNVPAQCVLLNECGCKKHWDNKGFSTEIDVRYLKRIINVQSSTAVVLTS